MKCKVSVLMLFAVLILILLPINGMANSDNDYAKGAGIFKKLPNAVKAGILDEAELSRQQCAGHIVHRYYYDCGCLKQVYINIKTIKGPNSNKNKLYKEAAQQCIDIESIKQHHHDKCMGFRSTSRVDDPDSFCSCVGEKFAGLFLKKPYMYDEYITMQHTNSHRMCRHLK